MTAIPSKPRSNGWYGWVAQRPDKRDRPFTSAEARRAAAGTIPDPIRLVPQFPVYNQGNLGSCTANSAMALYRYTLGVEKKPDIDGSRLAQYFWSRYLEGSVGSDSGATIRDAVKVLATFGVGREADWPYRVNMFKVTPPPKVKRYAKKHLALQYLALDTMPTDSQYASGLQTAIATALAENKPVQFGFTVFESFESPEVAATGIVPMPSAGEKEIGGHSMAIFGKDDRTRLYDTLNSWAIDWGVGGWCKMPYDYIHDPQRTSDLWCLDVVK